MTKKPLIQGDLDGTCGIYSVENALGLLFPHKMNEEARAKLLEVICYACVSKWPGVLFNGTTVADIRAMLGAARKRLNNSFEWEQPFAHMRLDGFADFSQELGWRIKGDNAFAIVGISKPWSHWTVTHRLTEHEMIMTDSCHVKQIPLAKCGLAGAGTDYEFDYRQTFTLMTAKK